MVSRNWTNPLILIALTILGACPASYAQSLKNGSLTGRLSDLHSNPISGAIVTLRNKATGAETQTTTAKGGVYRFSDLGAGEYTLIAESRQSGRGQLEGIVIAAGHEARVKTAIAFGSAVQETLAKANKGVRMPESPTLLETEPPLRPLWALSKASVAVSPTIPVEVSITAEPLLQSPIVAQPRWQPAEQTLPTPASQIPVRVGAPQVDQLVAALPETSTPELAGINGTGVVPATLTVGTLTAHQAGAALVLVELAAVDATLLITHPSTTQSLPTQISRAPLATSALSPSQTQALPLNGRNWQNFVLDSPAKEISEEGGGLTSTDSGPAAISINGDPIPMAFSGSGVSRKNAHGASLIDPGASEPSIVEVQPESGNTTGSRRGMSADLANTTIPRGTNTRLHGQAFLFDRHNGFGPLNSSTQWVQETAPASLISTPVFTPMPYSPIDQDIRWGVGVGASIHRNRLAWVASFDSHRRNYPAVSAVRHPENFFAQPSNDQMQVLSARLGLSSANPVAAGLAAYSKVLETLGGLLGPADRTSAQWTGFGRIDMKIADRHKIAIEGTGARLSSPGGGFTRASERYGTHSLGSSHARGEWAQGRWEAFLTPNLLVATQGSIGHHERSARPETPSAYEQTLNVNAWGQLPQIVVDSRYGFSIGNPARFGAGRYPDEHLYQAIEQLSWVHGTFLFKAGFELSKSTDATSRLRNETGTYHYSSVENFASDALAFAAFGLNGQLDPMDQHNCDQTGRVWRDSTGTLHGLGYLPCYSYYTQTMGPRNWWLSTNDFAGYLTSQWQPTKRLTLSLAVRWERQQLPPPLASLQNADLPLTQRLPDLGNNWGPRASFAWGSGESHWPVLRFGYGMYFGRTPNAIVESALTQTGSLKGDLSFFIRPTDNLNAGGAPPFPYVLSGEPTSVVKPGAVEFDPHFRNGEIHQAEASIGESLPGHFHLEASAIASLGRRLPITVDANVDPAINPKTITYAVVDGNRSGPIKTPLITVPYFAMWPSAASATGEAGRFNSNYQQVAELFSRANSTYEAARLQLIRNARGLTIHARYTYAHAMDWNPNESVLVNGSSVLDPLDFGQEYGTSNLDVRHSLTSALIWEPKWRLSNRAGQFANGWLLSGTGQFHSGLPYSIRTAGSLAREFDASGVPIVALGAGINGYGGDNRIYGLGRNTYRYPSTWKADVRLGKRFNLGQMRQIELLAESFNLFNHQNVTELETVGYTIGSGNSHGSLPTLNFLTGLKTGQTEFGKPLTVNATDNYRERQIQVGARLRF